MSKRNRKKVAVKIPASPRMPFYLYDYEINGYLQTTSMSGANGITDAWKHVCIRHPELKDKNPDCVNLRGADEPHRPDPAPELR